MVGREVGIGAWGEDGSSIVSLGVKYAALKSTSHVELRSHPDHQIPSDVDGSKYQRHWHNYDVEFDAERSFEGVGPAISWEASSVLLDGRDAGRINVDWQLSGGMLFGKQTSNFSEETAEEYITGTIIFGQSVTSITDRDRQESKSVQTPVAGASLGLSYALDRMKLSAGYRWERYFDVIDGGIAERKSYDRTIDGPYFKLSVGFGR